MNLMPFLSFLPFIPLITVLTSIFVLTAAEQPKCNEYDDSSAAFHAYAK
jgi:hypothetical protein